MVSTKPGEDPGALRRAPLIGSALGTLDEMKERDLLDPLVRIERAIPAGRDAFSEKARREMEADDGTGVPRRLEVADT